MLNLITAAALAAATSTTAPTTINNHVVKPHVLRAALRAPESPRVSGEGPRYCVIDDLTNRLGRRRVCRTRNQWVRLGVDPVVA